MKSIIKNSDRNQNDYPRSLIQASLDPLVTISPEGEITDVNEASEKVTGVTREELIGTDFSNYFTEPENARAVYKKVFEEGSVSDYPLTIQHNLGKLTDVLVNASIYKDDKGNVLRVFAAARDIMEQKQASQYARSLLEVSLDPLVTISPEGEITDVNEASVKVTGVTREELIGTDFSNYFTEPENARAGYKKVFEEGSVSDYPLTIRNKQGKLADVLYNASVYKDDKGNILGVFAAATDVTQLNAHNSEREKRTIELANLKIELDQKIACLNEAAIVSEVDANFNIIFVNDKFCEISGYKREELLGVNHRIVKSGKQPDALHIGMMKTISTGGVFKSSLLNKKKGEKEFYWVDATIMPFKDLDGKIIKYVSIQFDITAEVERKQALIKQAEASLVSEEDLISSENRFRSLFDHAPQCMLVFDLKSEKIINANKSAVALFKYSTDDLFKMGPRELSPEWQPDGIASDTRIGADFEKLLEGKKVSIKWVYNDAHGDEIKAEVSINLLSDTDMSLVIVNIIDVTEKNRIKEELKLQFEEKKKQAEELLIAKEKAEESDRLKSAFLSNMSHEIRTPMNGILGFSDLLKTPNLSGKEQKKYINIIEKSGKRMLNMLNNIVSISKIESGLMEVNIQEVNINDKMDFIFPFFKPEIEGKGLHFLIKKPLVKKEAIIQSDPEKIYGIITNLVKNALKFTKEGTIELGYTLRNVSGLSELLVYVKDSGIGIPNDGQLPIFDRFIQADIASEMAYQGAGLGLSISKAYVELLGGNIWVESEEGKGSVFYFTLPYLTNPEEKKLIEND
jgi:PAS domain S-box-containing protein